MTKDTIIAQFGLQDGRDDDRFNMSVVLAKTLDIAIATAFRSVVSLEQKGLIELTDDEVKINPEVSVITNN